jgi:hypothetical protein
MMLVKLTEYSALKFKTALMKFQTANKLKADGILGYEVRKFLNK